MSYLLKQKAWSKIVDICLPQAFRPLKIVFLPTSCTLIQPRSKQINDS